MEWVCLGGQVKERGNWRIAGYSEHDLDKLDQPFQDQSQCGALLEE